MNNQIISRVVVERRRYMACACFLLLVLLCCSSEALAQQRELSASGKAPSPEALNTLTAAEKAAGWKLLFDGKTTAGWRGAYRQDFPPTGWVIEDGCLKVQPGSGGEGGSGGGDIITTKQYSNFELQLEWRLSPGGNSGIKYFVLENLPKPSGSAIGLEMQVLDDDRHPDAKAGINGNRTAGALYDLIAPQKKAARPIGEFNQVRLLVEGNHVEHWLNGVKVVEYELRSPELRALIAKSKYKSIPGVGEAKQGHILLQDHGNEVWFRNIKIRELPPK